MQNAAFLIEIPSITAQYTITYLQRLNSIQISLPRPRKRPITIRQWPHTPQTRSITRSISDNITLTLQILHSTLDKIVDHPLISTRGKPSLVVHTSEFRHEDRFPVFVAIVFHVGFDAGEVGFVDVDGCEVPGSRDLGLERGEEVFVFLFAHAWGAEDCTLFGQRSEEVVPVGRCGLDCHFGGVGATAV